MEIVHSCCFCIILGSGSVCRLRTQGHCFVCTPTQPALSLRASLGIIRHSSIKIDEGTQSVLVRYSGIPQNTAPGAPTPPAAASQQVPQLPAQEISQSLSRSTALCGDSPWELQSSPSAPWQGNTYLIQRSAALLGHLFSLIMVLACWLPSIPAGWMLGKQHEEPLLLPNPQSGCIW